MEIKSLLIFVRTTPKDELTTQKATEELILATQKEEIATRKSKSTTQNLYTFK